MNANALKHPRTQWEIEAAMLRAIEESRTFGRSVQKAESAGGKVLAYIKHDRYAVPAFSFYTQAGEDVSEQMRELLRSFSS